MTLRTWYPLLLVLLIAAGVSFFSLELGIILFLLGSVLGIIGRILKTHGKVTLNLEKSEEPADFSLFQAESSSEIKKLSSELLSGIAESSSKSRISTAPAPSLEEHGIDTSVFSKFQNSLEKASETEKKKAVPNAPQKTALFAKKTTPKKPVVETKQNKLTQELTQKLTTNITENLEETQEKFTLSSQGKSLAPKAPPPASTKKAPAQAEKSAQNITYTRQASRPSASTVKKKAPTSIRSEKSPKISPASQKTTSAPLKASTAKQGVLPKVLEELQVSPTFSDPKIKTSAQESLFKKLQEVPELEAEEDLFADIHVQLEGDPLVGADKELQDDAMDPLYDEGLSHALDGGRTANEDLIEAEALLELARKSFHAKKWSDAQASLQMYLAELQKMGKEPDPEALYLQTQMAQKNEVPRTQTQNSPQESYGNATLSSAKSSERISSLASGGDYVEILEELAGVLEKRKAYPELLPILHDLLNHHREQLNRLEMDRIYERIERTLEALADADRLLRTYKSHLEIKRVLKDKYGESMLLDLIGIHYYKVGDSEQSQHYYEENLRVKAEIAREGQNVITAE